MGMELWVTLRAVIQIGEVKAVDLLAPLEWEGNITAINNRLVDLMRLGFLTRRKNGRNWLYKAAKIPITRAQLIED